MSTGISRSWGWGKQTEGAGKIKKLGWVSGREIRVKEVYEGEIEGVSGRTSGGFGKEFLPPSSFLSIHNYSPPPRWQERGDRKGWNHKHNPIKSRCRKQAKKWSRADPQISRWVCGCFVLGRLILSRIGYSHIFHPLLTPSHFFLSLPAGAASPGAEAR